ncbi:hypothetical protein P3X46_025499 [Hevea brasiliensis]|uniref:SOSEKI DIX-like domain-containing protein n=1 Tax=Hevea brasiliensis TaxID=3981 RepID=A0ABQ9L7K3_HEVBR|nr:protein SOSEKI 5-like [Hevea brasiliensis]KAJ9160063.1 hypothetical protein P3X46_025499 [Hevea brasiliensis]
MATNSEAGTVVMIRKEDEVLETSPGTNKKQIQLPPKTEIKVAVVYYLSQNGQIEHPHFVEVPLSSPQGLYLRDVMKMLNLLRGQGMANMYSWASKRSYKNGFLWQDLSDDDFIYPCQGEDYILKGSLLLENSLSFRSNGSISSLTSRRSSEMNSSSSEDSNSSVTRRKNYSWSSIDGIYEHRVFKSKTSEELSRKGSDVSTQIDYNPRIKMETEETEPEGLVIKSTSKAAGSLKSSIEVYKPANIRCPKVERDHYDGRKNKSKLLMKLTGCGCGSKRLKDFKQMEDK